MLNSNHAALTSACDSVQELRLARAGEAKADRMKTEEEIEDGQSEGRMHWI